MESPVTAVELARQLGVDPKVLRNWLRRKAASGHPLLQGHAHNDAWVFSAADARVLAREFTGGQGAAARTTPWSSAPTVHPPAAPTRAPDARTPAQVAHELIDSTAYRAGVLTASQVPAGPGLYAWWHAPGLLPRIRQRAGGPTVSANGRYELAYIGIATSLRQRLLRSHLGSSTGSSTLRRALGAWLGTDLGWVTEWRSERVQHDSASEAAITAWMSQNLFVTWTEHPRPRDVELIVIAALGPPLNSQHNQSHPNWTALDQARREWRQAGAP